MTKLTFGLKMGRQERQPLTIWITGATRCISKVSLLDFIRTDGTHNRSFKRGEHDGDECTACEGV